MDRSLVAVRGVGGKDIATISGAIDLDGSRAAGLIAAATHELTLFAAVGLLIGGIDELVVDCLYAGHRLRLRLRGERRRILVALPASTMRFAIFIPAWDESAVIGAMLSTLSSRFDDHRLVVFVGTYPNDPATIAAVSRIAEQDPRLRLVVGARPGPTTKADCLNGLWHALQQEEVACRLRFDAILLHDAEDSVHRGELTVLADALTGADAAQLPVLPLPRPGMDIVGGTYLDEFAEAHGRTMPVRDALRVGLPLAGVGCAITRAMLERIAVARGGLPFDADSLTEDYELGLTIAAMGGQTAFVDIAEVPGGLPVAVHAYFPATRDDAVRQKTRWLLGIALAGWDRTGWGRTGRPTEIWMRMRDRRAPIAMLVLASAYTALGLWAICHALGISHAVEPWLMTVIELNGILLLWRLTMRAAFVHRRYGRMQALLSAPRMLSGNIIAMIASRRAVGQYLKMLRGAPTRWDKTAHEFPDGTRSE